METSDDFLGTPLIHLTLYGPCIVIYLRNKNQPEARSS